MRILNLGAAGFIGSHLTARLLAEGHTVIAVDQFDDKIKEYLGHRLLTFIRQDIREKECRLDELIKNSDLVIDLIAYANPGLYVKLPLEVFHLNFTENLKIAEICLKNNRRLIQFSSCEVYGKTAAKVLNGRSSNGDDPSLQTFSEDTSQFILGPVSKHRWIYSCAKQLLERVIHAYGLEHNFNHTIIRPFNFIGPRIDYLLDEADGIPRVFSFFMDALLNGTQMKLVDGGHHHRCYTYIEDAIEAIYRIVENPNGVCNRQIFNIGSPHNEVSIRELAEMMRDIYAEKFRQPGVPLPEIVEVPAVEFYGEGYEDSDRRLPDISKARSLLGWEPKWKLPELLETTIRYYVKDYLDTYRNQSGRARGNAISFRDRYKGNQPQFHSTLLTRR